MTAKTTGDEPGKTKRRRRVRVIEVIDDEDLDEVLEALDAEDEATEKAEKAEKAEEAEEAEEEPQAKPAAKPRPKAADEKQHAPTARPTLFGLGRTQAVVVVVLVALLASLAIWQWRTASSLSSDEDDRDAVREVASDYGNVALNYNAQNYRTQADKAQKLMAGDLLDSFKTNTLPSLAQTFQPGSQVAVSSKTEQVYVGSVDGRFATAVIMVEVALRTKDGQINQPATLLRLSLSKVDGDWKVTQQYASGVNEENKNQQQGGFPGVPGTGASKTPKAEKSDKPNN
ncbi:MAG: hypothetical protein ACRDNL_22060 [Spirillospora sp.]